MDRQIDGQTDGWIEIQMDRQIDGQIYCESGGKSYMRETEKFNDFKAILRVWLTCRVGQYARNYGNFLDNINEYFVTY